MRPPRSGPLQTLSDGEVLRLIARNLQSRARLLRERITPEPLWTRRPR